VYPRAYGLAVWRSTYLPLETYKLILSYLLILVSNYQVSTIQLLEILYIMSTAHKHLTAHARKLAWHRKQCLKQAKYALKHGMETQCYLWLFILCEEDI
jgi:hypothetical protein